MPLISPSFVFQTLLLFRSPQWGYGRHAYGQRCGEAGDFSATTDLVIYHLLRHSRVIQVFGLSLFMSSLRDVQPSLHWVTIPSEEIVRVSKLSSVHPATRPSPTEQGQVLIGLPQSFVHAEEILQLVIVDVTEELRKIEFEPPTIAFHSIDLWAASSTYLWWHTSACLLRAGDMTGPVTHIFACTEPWLARYRAGHICWPRKDRIAWAHPTFPNLMGSSERRGWLTDFIGSKITILQQVWPCCLRSWLPTQATKQLANHKTLSELPVTFKYVQEARDAVL